jgi:hypothetical protein
MVRAPFSEPEAKPSSSTFKQAYFFVEKDGFEVVLVTYAKDSEVSDGRTALHRRK